MRMATAAAVLTLVGLLALTGAVVAAPGAGVASSDLVDLGNDEDTERYGHAATADFGVAAGATDATLRVEHDHRAFVAELEDTPPEDRPALVEAYLEELHAEAAALLAADREAVASVATGDGSVAGLSNTVVKHGATASARQSTLADLANRDGMVAGIDLSRAATDVHHRYDPAAGPVRDRLLGAAADPDRRTTVGIEVTSSRLAMTGVDGDRYVREAVLYDRLGGTADEPLDLAEAEAIAAAEYPSSTATTAARDVGDGLFVIERSLPAGTVTAFVSASTRSVAVEHQFRWLDAVDLAEADTTTEFGVEVRLDRSFERGPLRVSVADADTGEPVDATVYLRHDGTWTPLGAADRDGAVWGPDPGGPIDIRVVTADGTITVSSMW